MSESTGTLSYKGRPLLRCGNDIYYGNMTDKFIIMLKLLSFRKFGDEEIPDKIQILMLYTDPDIKGKGKIVKTSEKDSMSTALELASAWLDRNK